ncbi:MAG: hypothetical protein R3A48_23440 [Polyangiales bacterium]
MRAPSSTLLVTLLLSTLACSGTSAVVGGGADAALDVGATDVIDDLAVATDLPDVPTAIDAPDVPVVMDVVDVPAVMDAPFRCARNEDCAAMTGTPACDIATGRCVACVPSADACPRGEYCAAGNVCVQGCRDDEACGGGGGSDAGVDGGVGRALRCDTSTRACVECVVDAHCPAGTLCVGSVCVAGCTDTRGCPGAQQCCNGACADPASSIAHCGGCGTVCAVANAMPACQNGMCTVGACTAPFADCDRLPANGCEAHTLTDVAHCGGCGLRCEARPNATVSCEAGRCAFACAPGFADCDGVADNGCEVDLQTDVTRCGACGNACSPPNGTAACVAGRCAVAACATGFGDCDGNASNGCEADLRSATAHCGGCGNACPARPNAFPGCLAGRCVASCVTGSQDCDGDESNGCEADLRVSLDHCGACGRPCRPARGVGVCAMGACRVASCDPGFADCDGDPSNGCEVSLQSDVSHCGACGSACSVSGGTPVCVGAVCGLGMCAAGRGDCDGNSGNGCETDLATAASHCGACGNACALPNATASCAGGRCAVASCDAGFADCDGNPSNGCEVNLRADARHCGACQSACAPANGAGACVSGRCAVASCNAGFADCDGDPSNGCEVILASDAAHCGACGARCQVANAVPACASGRCVVASCGAGFADCNGLPGDGCETHTASSPSSCGGCGRACSLPRVSSAGCAGGACTVGACVGGFGDCDGVASNGCETDLARDVNHCGACGRRPPEVCNLADDNCNGACDDVGGCRVAVHRSYRSSNGEHFYTTSLSEAACCGFRVENASFFHLYAAAQPGTAPFYRCLLRNGLHLYTTSSSCEGAGSSEGVMGHIAQSAVCGAVPLYRVYRPANGDHFYTTSAGERDSALSGGYVSEGVAGYVWPSPQG